MVTKLDRTAGKRATDLCGSNGLVATLLKAEHLAMQGMEVGDGFVKPRLDCVASILVSLVGNDGIGGEKVQKGFGFSRVVGVEETRDRGGELDFHGRGFNYIPDWFHIGCNSRRRPRG